MSSFPVQELCEMVSDLEVKITDLEKKMKIIKILLRDHEMTNTFKMDGFFGNNEENVQILMNKEKSIALRYSSAMKISQNARKMHEALNEKMKDRQLTEPTPERLFSLFMNLNESKDLKGDLVEIEAIAAIAADCMMENLKY